MRHVALFAVLFAAAPGASGQYCIEGRFGRGDTLFDTSRITVVTDLVYGEAVDWTDSLRELRLDLYFPDPVDDPLPLRPLVIYTHGGGFHGGSKQTRKSRVWAKAFARRGWVFAAVDYRLGWPHEDSCLASEVLYREAVYRAAQDVRSAHRWLREQAAAYRIDTSWVFLLGASAGSACAMFIAYFDQEDFDPVLAAALGPLDPPGATDRFPVRGVATKAAALEDLDVLGRADVSHILFHGNCDLTVPFHEGPLYHCWTPSPWVPVYGSARIAGRLDELDRCHVLYESVGNGHVAAGDDTVIAYASAFFTDILCGNCASSHWRRPSGKNVCKNKAGGTDGFELVYPNPTRDLLRVVIRRATGYPLPLRLVDMTGQEIVRVQVDFLGPARAYDFDLGSLAPGVYLLQLGSRPGNGRLVVVE